MVTISENSLVLFFPAHTSVKYCSIQDLHPEVYEIARVSECINISTLTYHSSSIVHSYGCVTVALIGKLTGSTKGAQRFFS